MSELSVKHLLGIKQLSQEDIELVFQTADNFKEVININELVYIFE